jgi:hypothetical protein
VIAGVALAALLAAELAPLACPPGTTRAGAPPPEDLAEWCGKPGLDGVPRREGPARSWYDDGALRLEERGATVSATGRSSSTTGTGGRRARARG